MSHNNYQLAGQLEAAFNSVGTSMLTDDFACKLLAYVYVMGGGNEAVTLHTGLNAAIAMAQEKLNIKGGEIPNARLLPLLQAKIKELEQDMDDCPWLPEIFTRYNLNPKKGPAPPKGFSTAKQK